jgi:uncharacterized membrane protein (DUF4010 family)
MDVPQLFEGLAAALAIGLLVGLERGWRQRDEPEGERSFGLRTFALSGLLGGVWGALAREGGQSGVLALAIAFAAYAGIALLFRLREVQRDGTLGATTMMAILLVFALGALATLGNTTVATAAGVALAGILAIKSSLHSALERMTWPELRATLVLLTMTLVLLPLLPDRGFGPGSAVNPREIWLLTILIAATSFAGYVAVRLLGDRAGIAITGMAGGLVSSTAVTISMAERAKAQADNQRLLMGGAALAGGVSLLRVLVFAGALNVSLLASLAWPLVPAAIAIFGYAAWALVGHLREPSEAPLSLGNPFDLRTVLITGSLLAVITISIAIATTYVGAWGVIAVAALSGVADVDAITLSLSRQASAGLSSGLAVVGILSAVAVNLVAKVVMAASAGGWGPARRLAAANGLAVLGALVGMAIFYVLGGGR